MNTDPNGLRAYLKQSIQLNFGDGEIVEATLLGIDPVRDLDLTYEVLRIVQPGAPQARGTAVGATVVARLSDLESWSPLT
jgi:hypothetical protein